MNEYLKTLPTRFAGIGPRDFVDIFILSVLFFAIYRYIRKRRAFPVLLGLVAFIGVRAAVVAFKLDASSRFFDFFYKAGVLVPIIIFQADIRSLLEKVGGALINLKNKLIGIFRRKESSREAEALIKAVTRLSSSRTGALIVLEKNSGTEDVAESGVKLDAKITSELICNLFFAPAPLHDGAIVIRGKRIYSAACFLPNYTDPSLSPSFGSRHRAAIGMSRSSDADIIVVSEEDGRISYANSGELLRGIEFTKLREIVEKYYRVSVRIKRKNGKTGKNSR